MRFLYEAALVREYRTFFMLASPSARGMPANPILESAIPSLLQIKAVAVLDAALEAALSAAGTKPKAHGIRNDLNGRIETAFAAGLLKDISLLHRARELRNDVAHEFDEKVSWSQLDADVRSIHGALQELGHVGPMPKLEVSGERNPKKVLTDPKARLGFEYVIAVREGDKVRADIRWSEEILGVSE